MLVRQQMQIQGSKDVLRKSVRHTSSSPSREQTHGYSLDYVHTASGPEGPRAPSFVTPGTPLEGQPKAHGHIWPSEKQSTEPSRPLYRRDTVRSHRQDTKTARSSPRQAPRARVPTANSHPKPARGRRTCSGVNTYVIVLRATPFPPPHLRQNKVKFKIETNYLASAAPRPREPGPRCRAGPPPGPARSPAQTPAPGRPAPSRPRPRPPTPPSAGSPPRGLPFPPSPLSPPPGPAPAPASSRPPARTDPRLCCALLLAAQQQAAAAPTPGRAGVSGEGVGTWVLNPSIASSPSRWVERRSHPAVLPEDTASPTFTQRCFSAQVGSVRFP
ncbi:hypothetical protein AAY473_016799, partial [Plecturocebus cupreus]